MAPVALQPRHIAFLVSSNVQSVTRGRRLLRFHFPHDFVQFTKPSRGSVRRAIARWEEHFVTGDRRTNYKAANGAHTKPRKITPEKVEEIRQFFRDNDKSSLTKAAGELGVSASLPSYNILLF